MRPLPEDPTEDHMVTIEAAILDVETRLRSFDTSQGELELVCPDNEVDQCVTETADFREKCAAQLLEGKKLLTAIKSKVKGRGSETRRSTLKPGFVTWTAFPRPSIWNK